MLILENLGFNDPGEQSASGRRILVDELCSMRWQPLTTKEDLHDLDQRSMAGPILLFKHSIRCSISSATKARMERAWTEQDDLDRTAYLLDLINHRALSNFIAERYGIEHASPQALIIHRGTCIHVETHFGITYDRIEQALDLA